MAASTRAITPTHTSPFSAPNASNTPSALGGNASKDLHPHAAAFGSHLTKSPKGLSPRHSPPPLAGADALADERRDKSRQPSPNPAAAVVQSLLGANSTNMSPNMSRPKDAPPEPTQMSEAVNQVAKSIVIPDQVTVDNMQTSPVSLSSFGSQESAPTATAIDATAPPGIGSLPGQEASTAPQHPHQPIAPNPGDGPANRALTYPGPFADHDPRAPARQMSMPGYPQASPKSPNAKRHKCPYCSTDFTRHHNLKSHLLTHSQEKPYECPTCQARFRRLHDLKRHTKLHTGERPHTCPKCGRKFARGDALARHNKGQGGCAGRRSSFGLDDDLADAKGEDAMDGVVFHGEHDGDERIEGEDAEADARRRVSEPARKRQNTGNSTQGPYYQHSSTYPPIAANRPQPGAGTSLSSIYANTSQSGVFSQSNMTESPRPLSPGQQDQRHAMGEGSLPGARSPNLANQMHQFGARGASRGSSMGVQHVRGPDGLPNLPSLPPTLPPMPGTKGSQGGKGNGPSILQHQHIPGAGAGSQPGSISSHGTGSAGSLREIVGGQDANIWQYIRELEEKLAKTTEDSNSKIARLEDEVRRLQAQLAQPQVPVPPSQ